MSLNLPQIPDKLRGPLKVVGYVLFALVTFLTAIYVTFPYEKVKDRLEAELSSSGEVEVTIGRLGPSPLFGVTASDVIVQQKVPAGTVPPGEKKPPALRIVVDRATVSFSPFGALIGRKGIDFSIKGLGGRVSGSYVDAKGDVTVKVKVHGVSLAALPGLKDLIELPFSGALSGELEITMPKGRMAQAHGELEVTCDACTVGDGKARLKIPAAAAMFAEGVLVDRVALGKFGGRIVIDKGTAKFQQFGAKSPDLELQIEGEVGLADTIGMSSVRTGYVTFRPTDAGKKKQPFTMMDLALAATAKRPDGFFGWRVAGLLKKPSFTASKFSPVQPPTPGRPVGERPKPAAGAGRAALGGGSIRPPGSRTPGAAGAPAVATPTPPGGPPALEPPPPAPPPPPPGAPGAAAPLPPPPAPPPPVEQPGQPEPPAQPAQPEQPEQPAQPDQPE